MFQKILVAVNLSETCPQILEEAIQLAKCHHSKLMLIHVILVEGEIALPVSLYPVMGGYSNLSETALEQYQESIQAYKWDCMEQLRRLQTQVIDQGVEAEISLMSGETGESICQGAEEWQGDLIVLGTRGLRGIKEMVLGSVSNYVTHHAPCPVLVLRPQDSLPTPADSTQSMEALSAQ